MDWQKELVCHVSQAVTFCHGGSAGTLRHIVRETAMRRLLIALAIFGAWSAAALGDVDLRISDDETYKRPNAWSLDSASPGELMYAEAVGPSSRPGISIAWRNANQVEEVEVRVQNLGDEPGEGRLFVDVVDETGKVLLHLEPPDEMQTIRVPAFERGGREGKIIRMKASWELNAMIDRFDLTRTRYGVRATVETLGPERNWADNTKTKEWNTPFRVDPGAMNVFNYKFSNHSAEPLVAKWMWEHSDPPEGWVIEGLPNLKEPVRLAPGATLQGSLFMRAPDAIEEGAFLEARLSLVDADTSKVIHQHEWFQVHDTVPPEVTNYRAVLLDNHTLAIQALVADKGSGVLEATGVSTEYSLDAGKTWGRTAHNYKVGNFVRPTLFEAVLGPFPSGTTVQFRFTAKDTAGNAQTIIPEDATAFRAPPNSALLFQQAYIFPRTQQNPVFDLEKLKRLSSVLDDLKREGVDIESLDPNNAERLGLTEERLRELGTDARRLADIRDDLKRLQELKVDFSKIAPVELRRVKTLGDSVLNVTTLELAIQ